MPQPGLLGLEYTDDAMTLEVLWVRDCPGYVETEVVDGLINVTCHVEDPPSPPSSRVTADLQLLYTFAEQAGAAIRDQSGVGAALDLTVESQAATSWNPEGGLSVDSPTIIASSSAATKLITAVKASGEISLEVWVKPASLTQDGPARIITVSADYSHSNVTLAQAAEAYDARIRAPETTAGGRPSLASPPGTVTLALTHVVYTRASMGPASLYVNGSEVGSKVVSGDLSIWDAGYRLALANELAGGRAWLGEFRLVAAYSRALSAAEVEQNFRSGLPAVTAS